MRNAGVWAGIIVLGFALTIFHQALSLEYTTTLGPGPGFFPRWLSGILIVLSVCYIWDSIKNEIILTSEVLPKGGALQDILLTLGGLILFTVIVSYLGFVISGTILLFIMFMRHYKWHKAFGISLGISLLLLFGFQTLLGVSLPVNEFGW